MPSYSIKSSASKLLALNTSKIRLFKAFFSFNKNNNELIKILNRYTDKWFSGILLVNMNLSKFLTSLKPNIQKVK